MSGGQWTRGDDVWVCFAEGVFRGRYAGMAYGLHYVQLDGDERAQPIGNPRWIHATQSDAQAAKRAGKDWTEVSDLDVSTLLADVGVPAHPAQVSKIREKMRSHGFVMLKMRN